MACDGHMPKTSDDFLNPPGSPLRLAIENDLRLEWWHRAQNFQSANVTGTAAQRDNFLPDSSFRGRGLSQISNTAVPTQTAVATGPGRTALTFDGTNDVLASPSFTLPQPFAIGLIVKQVAYTADDPIIGGTTAGDSAIYMASDPPGTGYINMHDTASGIDAPLAVGSFGLVVAYFNGASSWLSVNGNITITGSVGTAGITGGINLGSGPGSSAYGNVQIGESFCLGGSVPKGLVGPLYRWAQADWGI